MDNKIPPPIVALVCGLAIYFLKDVTFFSFLFFPNELSLALFLSGGSTLLLAAGAFKKHQTTVNPLKPESASHLVTSGVFKFSRNPMYLGMLLVLIGLSIRFNPLGGLILCGLFVGFITKFQIIPEERAMKKIFGEQFEVYATKTRRWL